MLYLLVGKIEQVVHGKESLYRFIHCHTFFWVIPKITSTNLCKPVHEIMHYCTFVCHIESGKWKNT